MKEWKMGKWTGQPRMWLSFPYSAYVVARVKEIPGARYEFSQKLWSFPLDLDIAKDVASLARELQFKLIVEDDLKKWAQAEKQRYAAVLKPDDLTADVSGYLPHLRDTRPSLIEAMESKPWQIPGAAFIVGQKQVLLADKPGLGKTIQTLAAIAELDIRGPILVVAPRSAVSVTWPDEIRQWLGAEVIVRINSQIKPAERKKKLERVKNAPPGSRTWVLVGPNYLRIRADFDDYGNYMRDEFGKKIIRTVKEGLPELFDIEWQAVIVDESHQTLAGATGNKKKQSAQRLGLGALKIAPNAPQIAISGTPFRGKTENIWGTLNWLDPQKYSSYWKWVKRHYGVMQTTSQFGSGVLKGDRIVDERRFFKELEPIMVRRTKEEVQKDLPPKTYGGTHLDINDPNSPVAVWLPMSVHQRAQYNSIVKDAMIRISDTSEINVNGVLAEMTRFKQLANACLTDNAVPSMPSNKAEWIIDFLKDRQEAGTKVIVASQFTGFLNMLSNQLTNEKIGHYLFTGKTGDVERTRIREEFQKEETDLFVLLNTKSGGVSLTLDMADDVVVCDQTWIPDDQEQVEDRAHRVSRNHNVTIWNLASLGTIDEAVAVTNSAREDAIFSILEGQRGVAYVKAIISKMKGAA